MEVKLMKCETCLSGDRQLVCLSKIKSIIYEIQLPQILNTDGGVCWECHRIMVKFYKFRVQVTYAQEELSRNIKLDRRKEVSLSCLSSQIKQCYDFEYIHYNDPLIYACEEKIKAEPILTKQEDGILNSDTDYDDKPLCMVFADSIKIKNAAKDTKRLADKRSMKQDKNKLKKNILKKKKHLKKEHLNKERNRIFLNKEDERKNPSKEGSNVDSVEVLKEKFVTVTFTEEEMLKCREEKRNQPNFKKIPYNCSTCVIGFTKKENYDLHLRKIHDESIGPHSCSVCSARFPSGAAADRHRAAHYVQHRCRLCAYSARSCAAAVRHAARHHAGPGAGTQPCTHCAFVARTSSELSEHVKNAHSFACDECGIKFKGKHTLRTHNTRIHAVKREFSCEVCSRTFVSRSRYESHTATHSAAAAKRLAYCAQCRIQYKSIYVYRNHLKNSVKHVRDRIPCPQCDKLFASRVYWKRHYRFYHLQRSAYKCLDCDKLFMSRWRLKIHKQTHHGLSRTRDHACSVCGKKFYTKATLLTHSLLHAASRAFMCALCGATFRQRAALYTHARLTHRART